MSLIFGLALLPWTLATLFHWPRVIFAVRNEAGTVLWIGLGGILYALFEVFFQRPMRTYVFGHELTHALACVMMGGKVRSFNVSKHSGSVAVTKTNFLVALAPYFVPLYAIFVLMAYEICLRFHPFPNIHPIFQSLIGLTLAFHASLTVHAIRQKQPDIHKTGTFFSLVFILLMNVWVLTLFSKVLFWNEISLKGFFWGTFNTHLAIWEWVFPKAWAGIQASYLILLRIFSLSF